MYLSVTALTAKTDNNNRHFILLRRLEGHLPILDVSKSNTTSVDFGMSDELRGTGVGG